jgi:hypothetical protein
MKLWIHSDIFIISFYIFNVSSLCTLHYLRWAHGWLKHVGSSSVYMVCVPWAEGPGKESGGRGRWRGNPGIQFDLPQLSPRLCSSRCVSKVRSSFCVLSGTKTQRSLEKHYAIMFCAKLGKSGSETLQLLRTAYGDSVLSSGGTRRSRTEGRALRTNSAQGVLQLQELRTMWLV